MEIKKNVQLLAHEAKYSGFTEQILDIENIHRELPEFFIDFWKGWHQLSQEHSSDFYDLLGILEQFLFQSSDNLLAHPLSLKLCQMLRFWQWQIRRLVELLPGSKQRFPLSFVIYKNTQRPHITKINLNILIETWELFQKNFIPKLDKQYYNTITRAMAIPYSSAGLTIIKNTDQETLQNSKIISRYLPFVARHNFLENSFVLDILNAKFQKTLGYLTQSERILQNILQQESQNTNILSSVIFELCDIYSQTEQRAPFYQNIRRLLLQNPLYWDFSFLGSPFCSQMLQELPHWIRNYFSRSNPVILNWGGLYALSNGHYGKGAILSHQEQRTYWNQILQLKKAISNQNSNTKQPIQQKLTKRNNHDYATEEELYSLQKAHLLVYYVLILEHLYWVRNSENSPQTLEKNSILWQNVMIEIYSLSEDIFQQCKNRFS